MLRRLIWLTSFALLFSCGPDFAPQLAPGSASEGLTVAAPESPNVLVVYNASDANSLAVANYYISRRGIPTKNLCPLAVTAAQVSWVNWTSLDSVIRTPIQNCLTSVGAQNILYIVFTFNTPYSLGYVPAGYGSSLDSYVADVWNQVGTGTLLSNPYSAYDFSQANVYVPFQSLAAYRQGSTAKLIYSVAHLDGPTAALAMGLVDKAIEAEQQGIDGQGCFDRQSGNITTQQDSSYGSGEWDIYRAAQFVGDAGFAVTQDQNAAEFGTLPAPLRCDDASFYAGWYSYANYNDAFTWTPGAIGLHLDSASAANPRGPANWAGEALHRGITATSGAVGEPYLDYLVHPDGFYRNLLQEGANLGDALLRNTYALHWQVLNLGDPLYRPFPQPSAAPTLVPAKVVLSGGVSISAAVCSAVSVVVKDATNHRAAVVSSTPLEFLATGSAAFYADSGCTSPLTAISLAAGASSQQVYVRDAVVETVTLQVIDPSSRLSAATLGVTTHQPTHLALIAASTFGRAVCTSFQVRSRDALGNRDNVPVDTMLGLSTTGAGKFFSDSACTAGVSSVVMPANTNSLSFYFKDLVAESSSVQVTAVNGSVSSASWAAKALPAAKLVLSGSTSINTSACFGYTISSEDASSQYAGVSSTTSVTLGTTGGGGFFSDAYCKVPISATSVPQDADQVRVYYKASPGGPMTLSATDTAGVLTAASLAVTSYPPVSLSMSGSTSVSAGACSAFTVWTLDANFRDVPVAQNLVVDLTHSGAGAFYSTSSCTSAIASTTVLSGHYSQVVYFRDTQVETQLLGASDPSGALRAASFGVATH